MKRTVFLLLAITVTEIFIFGQSISPNIIGTNYWHYDKPTGNLVLSLGNAIDTAGYQTIRIGGFGANDYTFTQFRDYIQKIQAIGAEPIVQVKFDRTNQQVIDFITYINVTQGLNVKYWSIGNEPDHTMGGNLSADSVGKYTRRIASALKSVDPTIKTIGLDYSYYSNSVFTALLGGTADISGKDANSNYYIDIISWHKYNVLNIENMSGEVNSVLAKLAAVNSNRAESPMGWMIGEFNMHWDNSLASNPDQKVWSFYAGHFFSDLFEFGMRKGAFSICSWSIFESDGARTSGDLGMFDASADYPRGRSSYFHGMMLGQNMKQNLITNEDNQDSVKIISMADTTGVAVMIMNNKRNKTLGYSLRLDNTYGVNSSLTIKVNANLDKEIPGEIPAFATQMIVFDSNGNFLKLYTYTSKHSDERVGPVIEYSEPVNGILGTNSNKDFIQLFPNPASSNQITILNGAHCRLSFIDLAGNMVLTCDLYENEEHIDISNIQTGIYLVQIAGESNYSVKKMVII